MNRGLADEPLGRGQAGENPPCDRLGRRRLYRRSSGEMTPLPLKFGTAEEFAACRRLLQKVGYTEEALLARYRLKVLSDLRSRPARAESIKDPLELLTQLFADGQYVTANQIASLLPHGALEALAALGLVRPSAYNSELWAAPVMLYPRSGVF